MSELHRDYFREIDLNPTVNGAAAPIFGPLDPRAMHYFGFIAEGQELSLISGLPAGARVLYAWGYGNAPGWGPSNPPQADGMLDFAGASTAIARYDGHHDRAHVLVWLDGALPPQGQQLLVRVRAWRAD